MGTSIGNADYRQFPTFAKDMRDKGIEIKRKCLDIRRNFAEELHKCWRGNLYNDLITIFNEMIPEFESIMKLLIETIPEQIEIVANNYSVTDAGERATTVGGEIAGKIDPIPIVQEVLSFDQVDAETIRKIIISDFSTISGFISQYLAIFHSMPWESDAQAKFNADINAKKDSLDRLTSQMQNAFAQYMQQASDALANAERHNTIQ